MASGDQYLRTQNDVLRALAGAGDVAEGIGRTLEILCRRFDWPFGAWWTLDEQGGVLRCEELWLAPGGLPPEFEARTRALELAEGEGLPGRVWGTRHAVSVVGTRDFAAFPRAAAAAAAGFQAAFGFPIESEGRLAGVLEFFSASPRPIDDGLSEMILATGHQVGEFRRRMLAERRVRESEARHAAILAAALDCVITIDQDGRVVDFNPAAERTFGYAREDALGRELGALIVPPSLRENHRRAVRRYLAGEVGGGALIGRRVELPAVRADGSEFPVELTLTRVDAPGPALVTGYVRDLSERARHSEERARLVELERAARAEAQTLSAQLQAALLPTVRVADPSVRVLSRYRPSELRLMLGGDFLDVAELADGTIALVIGDVSGHGPAAAALGTNLRAAWRMLAHTATDHTEVLHGLDVLLQQERDSPEFFATVACAWLPPARDRVLIASAGHPMPLRLAPPRPLAGPPGPPLGATDGGAHWPLTAHELEPGDALLFYTDGLIEGRAARGSSRRLGLDGLIALLDGARPTEADMDALVRRVASADADVLADDIGILLIHLPPPSPAAAPDPV